MNHEEAYKEWDLTITPKQSLFALNLKDVWRYRDLLGMFVKRDFIANYKQTILGPLWFFLQPLFTALIYTFVFGRIAGISTDGIPRPLFYLTGITAWNYFADCLGKTSSVFTANASIFGKVYFPRLIMPLSIIISNLIRFGIQLILLAAMVIWYSMSTTTSIGPNYTILFLPFIVILLALWGLGIGMLVSSFTTKYKDLQYLMQFGVTLLMYATPVIYPLSTIPEKYRDWMALNPLAPVIECFRYMTTGSGSVNVHELMSASAIILIVAVIGLLVFNRTERNFIDTI